MKKRAGKNKLNWKFLILSFLIAYGVAFAGSFFTQQGVRSFWYLTIRPSITPPNWVFAVVWNILFFLIAIALYLSLNYEKNKTIRAKTEIVFSLNLLFNFLWSIFYFALRKPLLAFFDLILLWLSIFALMYFSYKINKKIIWLLLPYLLWITFAGVLNYLSAFR
jgi:benzodiazapine receptor